MFETGVLVIGANSEVAAATADEFHAVGARVAGVGLTDERADAYDHLQIADCSDSAAADAAVQRAAQEMGGLDTLVLGAAVMPVAAAALTTDDQWRRATGAILDSAFYCTRAAMPLLGEGSAIVALTSINSQLVAPGLPAYSAAKAGVEGLMRQVALEYGPRGIRANTVCPAAIHSDPDHYAEGYPLRRVARPDEVAKAIRFLGTAESSFVTGVTLVVDGGLSIASPVAWLRNDLRNRWLPDQP